MQSFKRYLAEGVIPPVVYRAEVDEHSTHGHWYAFDKELAGAYGEEGGPVNRYRLSCSRPLIIDTPEKAQAFWTEHEHAGHYSAASTALAHRFAIAKKLSSRYDCIVVAHSAFEGDLGHEWAASTWGEPQIQVFDPKRHAHLLGPA